MKLVIIAMAFMAMVVLGSLVGEVHSVFLIMAAYLVGSLTGMAMMAEWER